MNDNLKIFVQYAFSCTLFKLLIDVIHGLAWKIMFKLENYVKTLLIIKTLRDFIQLHIYWLKIMDWNEKCFTLARPILKIEFQVWEKYFLKPFIYQLMTNFEWGYFEEAFGLITSTEQSVFGSGYLQSLKEYSETWLKRNWLLTNTRL